MNINNHTKEKKINFVALSDVSGKKDPRYIDGTPNKNKVKVNDHSLDESAIEKEVRVLESIDLGSIDDFDSILTEVEAMQNEEYKAEEIESSENPPHEETEAIFADGYMQGSLEQKKKFESELELLNKTICNLTHAYQQPAYLSNKIEALVREVLQTACKSMLDKIDNDWYETIVGTCISNFTRTIEAEEVIAKVYCNKETLEKLTRIKDTANPSRENSVYEQFIESDELLTDKFRLEIDINNQIVAEGVLDINDQKDKIIAMMSEF